MKKTRALFYIMPFLVLPIASSCSTRQTQPESLIESKLGVKLSENTLDRVFKQHANEYKSMLSKLLQKDTWIDGNLQTKLNNFIASLANFKNDFTQDNIEGEYLSLIYLANNHSPLNLYKGERLSNFVEINSNLENLFTIGDEFALKSYMDVIKKNKNADLWTALTDKYRLNAKNNIIAFDSYSQNAVFRVGNKDSIYAYQLNKNNNAIFNSRFIYNDRLFLNNVFSIQKLSLKKGEGNTDPLILNFKLSQIFDCDDIYIKASYATLPDNTYHIKLNLLYKPNVIEYQKYKLLVKSKNQKVMDLNVNLSNFLRQNNLKISEKSIKSIEINTVNVFKNNYRYVHLNNNEEKLYNGYRTMVQEYNPHKMLLIQPSNWDLNHLSQNSWEFWFKYLQTGNLTATRKKW
ncbi:hypothetical protein [Mycoplasma simbae]|uniref:hypothetical protein n=1 Tax=Mycoplasma simbae TaxID=36744 RepID=UPI0004978237|nr:hypothetical protein [Mycoplasma simbae]